MIDIQAKIHDQYSLEFKVGYIARPKLPKSDFVMNTWIFIPDSLDINRRTYPKEMFYKDVRSYMRLITPVFQLSELAKPGNLPFKLLKVTCQKALQSNSDKDTKEFESQAKMYASIYKSAIRNAYQRICFEKDDRICQSLCLELIKDTRNALYEFRGLTQVFQGSSESSIIDYYLCADEFISNVAEQHLFLLADYLNSQRDEVFALIKASLFNLLDKELEHKKRQRYLFTQKDDEQGNQEFVHNAGLLKKYAESNLYLRAKKRHNAFFIEQVAFMIAAGISMTFATVIAFSFQQTFGNFTLPLFIALVVSYMFKDRIKELIRFYFAYKLGSKFFDYKITMSIHDKALGWCKEGFDYITANKLPRHVKEKRGRTSLLETRRGIDEQIMLYRKKLRLHRKNINKVNQYPLIGVNDIIRVNLFEFTKKMDNPKVPIYINLGNESYNRIDAGKIYYINYIIQCRYQGMTTDYYRYRIAINKEGIQQIDKID